MKDKKLKNAGLVKDGICFGNYADTEYKLFKAIFKKLGSMWA